MSTFIESQMNSFSDYKDRLPELEAYLVGRWLTDLSNFASFVYHSLPRVNWAGFYLFDGEVLCLGPFVGKPACTKIFPDRGVCGKSFSQNIPLLVGDVEKFPGHIVCDSASRSELVLPFSVKGERLGVFDLDSPELERFHDFDQRGVDLWLTALGRRLESGPLRGKPWA